VEEGSWVLLAGAVSLALLNTFVMKAVMQYFRDQERWRNNLEAWAEESATCCDAAASIEDSVEADRNETETHAMASRINPVSVLFTDTFRWCLVREYIVVGMRDEEGVQSDLSYYRDPDQQAYHAETSSPRGFQDPINAHSDMGDDEGVLDQTDLSHYRDPDQDANHAETSSRRGFKDPINLAHSEAAPLLRRHNEHEMLADTLMDLGEHDPSDEENPNEERALYITGLFSVPHISFDEKVGPPAPADTNPDLGEPEISSPSVSLSPSARDSMFDDESRSGRPPSFRTDESDVLSVRSGLPPSFRTDESDVLSVRSGIFARSGRPPSFRTDESDDQPM
jgi:hypothetical protein